MGDDAVFHMLAAAPFAAGYRERDERGRARLDQVFQACARECSRGSLEAGWDFATDLEDTSLDDRLEGEQLEAWQELRATLLASEACPWFERFCDARDARGGVVEPQALARLVGRLRETGVLPALAAALDADDTPSGFAELDEFLQRAAGAGAWLVWYSR